MINTSSRHSARTIYQRIMLTLYGIALLTCFICNLAVSHSLSWFFIVFCSVALAFSVTNLPLLLPGHKLLGSAFAVTVFLYLLLYVCNLYTGGGWFVRYAVPIASFSVAFAWLMLLTIAARRINWFYRSAVLSLLSGILILTQNVWVSMVIDGRPESFGAFFQAQFSEKGAGYIGNAILAACFFIYFLIGILLGILASVRHSATKNRAH